LTAQIWQGGAGLELPVNFIFRARKDAALEVVKPLKQLMHLMLPKDGPAGVLIAPFTPNFTKLDAPLAGIGIEVKYGNFFTLPQAVITSMNFSTNSIFDERGLPLEARVDLQIKSYYIVTSSDIDKMIESSPSTKG
jgi:hypothetical protein